METQVLGHAVGATVNDLAMHSAAVMEKFANGENYNEAVWIERGRFAVRQTLEGMFELGRALIIIKEHTPHGRFTEITEKEFGLHKREAQRLMNATLRFIDPKMKAVQPKLMDLGKSKLLELLVEDDDSLIELADGGDINGHTLDDIDRMTRNELRIALRESRENLAAKDEVMKTKTAKIDELAEKLEKSKKTVKEPDAADVGSELAMRLTSLEVGIRSQVSRLKEMFEQMAAHTEAHGIDHRATMVGTLNQIILDCENLRSSFALPQEAPTDDMPEWMKQEG
ncbi:hypothetical protein [Bergeriella denitrificans]|uniref:Phage protein n=1 Tax=Bergeriella denitrificans TaxID=494 RepID=A0A378UU22_BERDE|nr:hypothetical protein [Bergeriella denitrificans]STZ76085.1 phage protein [Bergeriella denitrificans]STZ83062.1 phage protein [Bergeriella denitrificans]